MTVLVVGGSGMLGRAWMERLAKDGREARSLDLPDFDLTDAKALSVVDERASLVVCCAAYTDVDGAETNEDAANAVNGAAVAGLAGRCAQLGVPLIHYSTDYVFDGAATSPYPVDTPRAPLNAYGRSKATGEEAVETAYAQSTTPFLLIRTSWLYASWAKNFVLTMAHLTEARDSLSVVDDQRGRPTSAVELARVSLALFDAGASGTFHVTDGGECTWHGLARFVAEHLGHRCDIQPCTTDAFPRPAPRPGYSVLDVTTTEAMAGALRPWQRNVADVLDAWRSAAAETDEQTS